MPPKVSGKCSPTVQRLPGTVLARAIQTEWERGGEGGRVQAVGQVAGLVAAKNAINSKSLWQFEWENYPSA